MWAYFRHLGQTALIMSHYDLAGCTEWEAEQWKEFLNEPDVVAWVNSENKLLQETEIKKMINNINESNSVGKAQIINSLSKLLDNGNAMKEGPAFIYTYVPLSPQQAKADNVITLQEDVFSR